MPAEYWYTIIQYFVSIIIVIALLFALMESSRKYDKYRQWPYIVVAIGYFLLVVWALIRAMMLSFEFVPLILSILQVSGFVTLMIGYLYEQQFEKHHQLDGSEVLDAPEMNKAIVAITHNEKPKTEAIPEITDIKKSSTVLKKAVSADATVVEKELKEESQKSGKKPEVKPTQKPAKPEPKKDDKKAGKKIKKEELPEWMGMLAAEEDDKPNSNSSKTGMAKVSENKKEEAKTEVTLKANDDIVIEKSAKPETKANTPVTPPAPATAKKSTKTTGPVDLSYLAKRPRKSKAAKAPKPDSTKSTTEDGHDREVLMEELFPIAKTTADEPLHNTEMEATSAQAGDVLPGEHREAPSKSNLSKTKNIQPVGLLAGGMGMFDWMAQWPIIAVMLTLAILIVVMARNTKVKGNTTLMYAFIILTASALGRLLLADVMVPPTIDITDTNSVLSLLVIIFEVLGYVFIGLASWFKIKGKITHHFLSVIAIVYMIMLFLTASIANFVVKDQNSLNLLLLLSTGTMIMLLPIIHSIAFSHTAEDSKDGIKHETATT